MPETYYDRFMVLLDALIEEHKVPVAELHRLYQETGADKKISAEWIHKVYKRDIPDPGVRRMDALYPVLQKESRKHK